MKQEKKNRQEQPPPTGGEAERRDGHVGGQTPGGSENTEIGADPRARDTSGEERGTHNGNQKLLIGIAVAILVLLIAGSSFALGYAMGNQRAGISTLVDERREGLPLEGGPPGGPPGGLRGPGVEKGQPMPEGAEEGERPDRQNPKDQIQEQLKDENTELIEGEVASIDGSVITVQGLGGAETVAVTGKTRFIGASGAEAGGGDVSGLEPGARVTMLIRKADNGSLEVIAVRVMNQ